MSKSEGYDDRTDISLEAIDEEFDRQNTAYWAGIRAELVADGLMDEDGNVTLSEPIDDTNS